MWTKQLRLWRLTLCILFCMSSLAITARGEEHVPSESECRPYIEKALHQVEHDSSEKQDSLELSTDNDSKEGDDDDGNDASIANDSKEDDSPSVEVADEPYVAKESTEDTQADNDSKEGDGDDDDDTKEGDDDSKEADDDKEGDSKEDATAEDQTAEEDDDDQDDAKDGDSKEDDGDSKEVADDDNDSKDEDESASRAKRSVEDDGDDSTEKGDDNDDDGSHEKAESNEDQDDDKDDSKEKDDDDDTKSAADDDDSAEKAGDDDDDKSKEQEGDDEDNATKEDDDDSKADDDDNDSKVDDKDDDDSKADDKDDDGDDSKGDDDKDEDGDDSEGDDDDDGEGTPEEELLLTKDIPENLRSRDHLVQMLRLDDDADEAEQTIERSAEIILRDLKRIYENNIKPLETLYKYRDLSNRHFGDPEIFSKPLILFMGPWSGGKSSILNYLTDLEFTEWSLRTGAEPSPAYFNILMHGKEPEVLDGTQLAADWTFSGLQKFGQGLEERLRGLKYPSKLLEKVNIVEIPGILEVRKQVSRVFPFNDACQWFIDRADIIFLVYDPSKLDVGPETEAILDQLKGRESQTRIVLNKADTVKPEELMRVQSALIWNISPLMSSPQPPVMYTVSLWSMPYEAGAPARLLQAQERELLRDLRGAVDKRIENKIASARRFAVRVRNHAKMVDCYLTTYYNHKTIFGNKRLIADAIIENPQNYHIYEGLSTLTNISRYDLPDPETYRDFFRLNPLYEFQQLSATCTYFRGCPITKLDVAIAYDLPELVGKYKKMVETVTPQGMPKS